VAGYTDNSFYTFLVGLELNWIVAFPYRGFLMDKVLFANPSPTYDTNSHSIRIFALKGTLVAFHCSSTSRSENIIPVPVISGLI
jgi:hypothetical protein